MGHAAEGKHQAYGCIYAQHLNATDADLPIEHQNSKWSDISVEKIRLLIFMFRNKLF